ncbi:DUF6602 domain-containing protein [Actinopolymorpha singaporensis]
MPSEARQRVRDYFRAKTGQLVAAAALANTGHSGLSGGHREELQRAYLLEVLPKRYGVGRGMVYGISHRSREADIVVWDALNYPSLPMSDHSFFFAESVRLVIESKSRWSSQEFDDVLVKCRSVKDIVPHPGSNLDDAIVMLQLEVEALKAGRGHDGFLRMGPHIGTAAVFISGDSQALAKGEIGRHIAIEEVDDSWPDVLLLLERGLLVLKEYPEDEEEDGGKLLFFDLGQDCLLAFTNAILRLIAKRSVLTESPFFLELYGYEILDTEPVAVHPFPLTRFSPGRIPLWRSH